MKEQIYFEIFRLLGGAGLFIFGMKIMTKALETAAGSKLRSLLSGLLKNQFTGLLAGTTISFLIHSGAATVMLVGFVNSGLMTFTQSIGVMLGANLGTTLSMQIVSFNVGKYCFLAIAIGFMMELFSKKEFIKYSGVILLGFGVLFLGMETMKDAVTPFKNSPYIAQIFSKTDASTSSGMIIGIAASTVLTGNAKQRRNDRDNIRSMQFWHYY